MKRWNYGIHNSIRDIRVRLAPEEENEYYKAILKYKNRNDLLENELSEYNEAAQKIALNNIRFAVSRALYFHRIKPSMLIMDIIQEVSIELFNAAKKYDYTRNVKFISYAVVWMNNRLKNGFPEDTVRIPVSAKKLNYKVKNLEKKLMQQNSGDGYYLREIAELLGVDERKIADASLKKTVSIDDYVNHERELTYLEIIDAERDNRVAESFRERYVGVIEENFSRLSSREQRVINEYFGLNINNENHENLGKKSMGEVGVEMNLTRERIRQIRNRALKKLRMYIKEEKC